MFLSYIVFSRNPDISEFIISLIFLSILLTAVVWRGGADVRHLIENRKRHILRPALDGFLIGLSLPVFICFLHFGNAAFAGEFPYPKDPRLWTRHDLFEAIKDEIIFALVLSLIGALYGLLVGLLNRTLLKIYMTHLSIGSTADRER